MIGHVRTWEFLNYLALGIRSHVRCTPTVHDDACDLLQTFNALVMPRAYMHVDWELGKLHYVIIRAFASIGPSEPSTWAMEQLSHEVSHTVDVIWVFDPSTRIWRVMKDRLGTYDVLYHSKAMEIRDAECL